MEESWKSFLPLRKMRRAQGPRANAPLCPRCHPLAGWAAACVPPSAPLFAPRFCRRGPSGQQVIPSGPPACRSLLWASAACSRTSALGREPFTDLLTRYLALDSPGGVHSLVNNPQWEFGLNCLSLVTLFINTNHPQANLHGVPREVAADSGLGESILAQLCEGADEHKLCHCVSFTKKHVKAGLQLCFFKKEKKSPTFNDWF